MTDFQKSKHRISDRLHFIILVITSTIGLGSIISIAFIHTAMDGYIRFGIGVPILVFNVAWLFKRTFHDNRESLRFEI